MNEAVQATKQMGGQHEESAELAEGVTLAGRYRIAQRLGAGGAGVVYAAHDELLGEEIALKVLHASLRKEVEHVLRLRNEVRAARRIAHPNVCRVHDLAYTDGLVFVAMERLGGPTLRQRMGERLSELEAMALGRQVAAGLGAAHRAGVVHCDVKPENAIFDRDRLVLTDFGIARLLHRHDDGAANRRGVVEGTPAWRGAPAPGGSGLDLSARATQSGQRAKSDTGASSSRGGPPRMDERIVRVRRIFSIMYAHLALLAGAGWTVAERAPAQGAQSGGRSTSHALASDR